MGRIMRKTVGAGRHKRTISATKLLTCRYLISNIYFKIGFVCLVVGFGDIVAF